MTEKPLSDKADREKMTQIMFETLNVPLFHVSVDSALSLFASGRVTGLVVDSGYGVTHTVPIHEGRVLREAGGKMDVGGREPTDSMVKLLNETGHSFTTTAVFTIEIARDMKEKLGYISQDFEADMEASRNSSDIDKTYELPDGQVITVARVNPADLAPGLRSGFLRKWLSFITDSL